MTQRLLRCVVRAPIFAAMLATTAVAVPAGAVPAGATPGLPDFGGARQSLGSAALSYVARPAANAATRVVLHLPLRNRAQLESLVAAQSLPTSPSYRRFLTPADFARRFGVRPEDVARVARVLASYGLHPVETSAQDVTFEGPRSGMEHAFGTELWLARNGAGRVAVSARRALTLPPALRGTAVVNFSHAILRHVHSHVLPRSTMPRDVTRPHSELSPDGGYLTSDLKQAYRYPSYQALRGRGATIGILVDGDFSNADMQLYFGVQHLPVPQLVRRPVDGGAPSTDGDSEETELDIQQSGGMAPGARIVHYNIPALSDQEIYNGLKAIVTDNIADVVNQSFGGCEVYYNGQYVLDLGPQAVPATLFAENDLILQGVVQGQTFVASSGDNGAYGCFSPAAAYGDTTAIKSVEFPASSPWEVAVGGTNLVTTYKPGSTHSAYVRENAYKDTANTDFSYFDWGSGGGESQFFPQPFYQSTFHIPTTAGRNVPDVAGHMGGCPGFAVQPCGPDRSSDLIAYGGSFSGVIGTSASAPDFAGLLALAIEANGGRLGLVDASVYALAQNNGTPAIYFNANVPGFNGLPTRPGYDEVTGVGSVEGLAFTGHFVLPVAGDPGTPSNPGPNPAGDPNGIPHVTAQPDSLTLIGRRDVDAGAIAAVGVDQPVLTGLPSAFDGVDGRCSQITLQLDSPLPSCYLSDFGLAVGSLVVEAFPNQAALFDPNGTLHNGWPKTFDQLFGPTFAYLGKPLCTAASYACRTYQNVHAAYDPATGRYWLTATEFDNDGVSGRPAASSQWLAVSATGDPNGTWHVFQYGFNKNDRYLDYRGAGFGFDAAAVYVTGDVEGPIGPPTYAYVIALDKHRLESGLPSSANGFSHLADRGAQILSLAPVHPSAATDETTNHEIIASTYGQVPGKCAIVSGCTAALMWSFTNPLTTPALTAVAATTANYRQIPAVWDNTGLLPNGGVLAMPEISNGRIALAFASGEFGPHGVIDGATWAEVAPTFGQGRLAAVNTIASGHIVSPVGAPIDFVSATADPSGRLLLTDVSFGSRTLTEFRERSIAGVVSAPTVIVNGQQYHGAAPAGTAIYAGYAAATYADGQFWFALPYEDASYNESASIGHVR